MGISQSDLDNWFTYHSPGPSDVPDYNELRNKGKELAELILKLTPACPDQSVAVRKVREAIMTANAAIACEDKAAKAGF